MCEFKCLVCFGVSTRIIVIIVLFYCRIEISYSKPTLLSVSGNRVCSFVFYDRFRRTSGNSGFFPPTETIHFGDMFFCVMRARSFQPYEWFIASRVLKQFNRKMSAKRLKIKWNPFGETIFPTREIVTFYIVRNDPSAYNHCWRFFFFYYYNHLSSVFDCSNINYYF